MTQQILHKDKYGAYVAIRKQMVDNDIYVIWTTQGVELSVDELEQVAYALLNLVRILEQ